MIRALNHHLRARKAQQQHYWEHLKAQYCDRMEYYRCRALSRVRGSGTICMIQDGMDQSKVCVPRDAALRGKDFSTFQRPKLHLSLTLCHGYFTQFILSNPDTMKDSNASCESLASAFDLLQGHHHTDLRASHIIVQADNTARELKNNQTMRFCAAQVSCGNIKSISLQFLRAGHSHEDIDQVFGRVARHLSRARKIQNPEEIMEQLRTFSEKLNRQHEPAHYNFKMDATRDWPFFIISSRRLVCAVSTRKFEHVQTIRQFILTF